MSEGFISPDDAYFKVEEEKVLNELVHHHNDIKALFVERGKMMVAINGMSEMIKSLKANRNKTLSRIIGGNYIDTIPNKDCIKMIQNQRRTVDNQLKAIEGQIMHRIDNFYEIMTKMSFFIRNRMVARGLEIPDYRIPIDETPSQEGKFGGH